MTLIWKTWLHANFRQGASAPPGRIWDRALHCLCTECANDGKAAKRFQTWDSLPGALKRVSDRDFYASIIFEYR